MTPRRAKWLASGLGAVVVAASLVVVAGVEIADGSAASARSAARLPARAAMCRVSPHHGAHHPLVMVVGASFTAGVGSPTAADNWAVRLAEIMSWRAVTLGVPGAGFTRTGFDGLGPIERELSFLRLESLHPSAVIIQAGHDDWRVAAAQEARQIVRLTRLVHREASGARLVFLTAFSRHSPRSAGATTPRAEAISRKLRRIETVIQRTVRAAAPGALVINPMHWRFQRSRHGLHPDASGAWTIARLVSLQLSKGAVSRLSGPALAASLAKSSAVSCHHVGTDHRLLPPIIQ